VVQALIFGAIHLPILFVVPRDFVPQGAVLVLGATISGWIMGYLNCRMADGSILPSWCMHGLGNTLAYALPLVAG
jgi:membrane protease YdiL (CAAX protease family)